ncbi:MAG: ATP-binding protein [Lachnospiraceae bacterium]|nr:ATP-binding protein [Lachnospiraceae bacterium]
MKKRVALGISSFEDIVKRDVFYVDKTYFLKDWYDSADQVTLITRPRRFGKTLTLSMVEAFFSKKYINRGEELFGHFIVWKDVRFRSVQGTYPLIHLSLADVKEDDCMKMAAKMKRLMASLYLEHEYLLDSKRLKEAEKRAFTKVIDQDVTDEECREAVRALSSYLYRHFDKKVLILIDEYDTPMLEAYTAGYWEEAIRYIRRLFHSAFKDNPYLERGLLTGITRITQESIFSDLNNLRVVTSTTPLYETVFGFTEEEVFTALKTYDLESQKDEVKYWYDGFRFGDRTDIYNPWSILNLLSEKRLKPYWMNTSGNALVGNLVREGSLKIKDEFEVLLNGGTLETEIDEAITYAELCGDSKTIWSWFLTTGYVKIVGEKDDRYEIRLTNYEVREALCRLVKKWFAASYDEYTDFIRMLLAGNLEGMQRYMEKVTSQTFSYFDVGSGASESEQAEQFYHGFTLGLIADLNRTHILTSNRESGLGRYDVAIEPLDREKDGILIEFKVFDPRKESTLEDTAKRALRQIEERQYEAELRAHGLKCVRRYGFAFRGKEVKILEG